MDWLASDLPIATHSSGAILVMTMDLKSTSSAIAQMDLDGMFLWLDLLCLFKVLQLLSRGMFVAYADTIFFSYTAGSHDKVIAAAQPKQNCLSCFYLSNLTDFIYSWNLSFLFPGKFQDILEGVRTAPGNKKFERQTCFCR